MATTDSISDDFNGSDAQLDDRDARALTEYMTVLPQGGDIYTVVGQNGGSYRVDSLEERCTCADHEHRDARCKHLRRVAFATGDRAIPGWVDFGAVDEWLGEHCDGEIQVAVPDGGRLFREGRDRYDVETVNGGALVWDDDPDELGRELVGFTHRDGSDAIHWASIRDELTDRGLGVGAIHELEVYEPEEVGY
jgi:hypothetical protein